MDENINEVAALANTAMYDSEATRNTEDPHLKHSMLRSLHGELVFTVYDFGKRYVPIPEVLDLGAGKGAFTLRFLGLGARLTAIDISESQLKVLKAECARYAERLEVRCEDVFDAVRSIQAQGRQYDIVVANSFLHHVPDYLGLIREAVTILSPHGQFLSFQDPLRYNSIGLFTKMFSTFAYFSWRMFRGNIIRGLKRRIRWSRGIYDLVDNAEYHAVRGGVDQDAICELFRQSDFECEIVRYFSTQSRIWQYTGTVLGAKNTFAVIARRVSGSLQIGSTAYCIHP
jgi:SAM-dependent methyltransferase